MSLDGLKLSDVQIPEVIVPNYRVIECYICKNDIPCDGPIGTDQIEFCEYCKQTHPDKIRQIEMGEFQYWQFCAVELRMVARFGLMRRIKRYLFGIHSPSCPQIPGNWMKNKCKTCKYLDICDLTPKTMRAKIWFYIRNHVNAIIFRLKHRKESL